MTKGPAQRCPCPVLTPSGDRFRLTLQLSVYVTEVSHENGATATALRNSQIYYVVCTAEAKMSSFLAAACRPDSFCPAQPTLALCVKPEAELETVNTVSPKRYAPTSCAYSDQWPNNAIDWPISDVQLKVDEDNISKQDMSSLLRRSSSLLAGWQAGFCSPACICYHCPPPAAAAAAALTPWSFPAERSASLVPLPLPQCPPFAAGCLQLTMAIGMGMCLAVG